MGILLFAISVTVISCNQVVQAEEDSLSIVNLGLFKVGEEECFVEGSDQEEEIPWVNREHGKVVWKVMINAVQEPVKIEVFRGEEVIPLEIYDAAGEYEIEITDEVYSGFYRVVVTDTEEHQTECRQYVKIDRQAPMPDDIQISFQASELDLNSISYEDIKENPIKNIKNFINHLFAKKMITVTFYAPDAVRLKFSYHNQKEYDLYSEECNFTAVLPVENLGSASEVAGKIMIKEVEDQAGNICRLEEGKEVKTQGMIILDDVSPVLSKVSYIPEINAQRIGADTYYFYQSSAEASFQIVETNFEGVLNEKEKVRLPIFSEGMNGEWIYDSQSRTASSKIVFSGKNGEEQEYRYRLFYNDPSGNLMTGSEQFVCANGYYQSDVIVIDQRPPCLKTFMIEANGETSFLEKDGVKYAANVEGDDVKITVVIDDHEKYFLEENVQLEYSVAGSQWKPIKSETVYSFEKRNHKLVYTFDGEENAEGVYQFRVAYKDCAGNDMILQENSNLPVKEISGGTYTSVKKVVIDHVNPKVDVIKFTKPVQMYQETEQNTNGEPTLAIKNKNTKLYYSEITEISVMLKEKFLKEEQVDLKLYYRKNRGESWAKWEDIPNLSKKVKAAELEIDFKLPKLDAEYYFTISYSDFAGNSMIYGTNVEQTELGEAYADGIVEDSKGYLSPIFVRDTKTPVYETFYTPEPKKYNSVECVEMLLTLSEMNLDLAKTMIKISAKDINGQTVAPKELEGFTYQKVSGEFVAAWEDLLEGITNSPIYPDRAERQTLRLKLSTEANYKVLVEMIDKTGKKAVYENSYSIDRTPPSITVVTKDGRHFTNVVDVQCGLLDFSKSDITYTVVDGGVIDRMINKLTFGYFSKSKLLVQVEVHDKICGVGKLVPTCINEDGEKTTFQLSEQICEKDDQSIVKYEIELPIDFKGTVQMHGIDLAENAAEDTGAIGMIVETEKQHEKYAEASIKVVTPYSKTPGYYAKDVEINYFAEDRYSGLCMINYQAGKYKETVTYPAGEEICTENSKTLVVSAKENNENHVNLALDFFDNAGHQEKISKENIPTVHIDQTSPRIEVMYDNLEAVNEKYYKMDRTATISITERNFDPEDTRLQITGPSADITEWKHVAGTSCKGGTNPSATNHKDDCRWVARIYFRKDGEYTFTCDTTDLAGNKSVYGQTDEFVIDKTIPEIKVTYDNHDAKNVYYYKAPRVAVVEIREHNFDVADVKMQITAVNEAMVLPTPVITSWISAEEIHRATITYDYDAKFEFEITYTDLAGNKAEAYEKDSFVVDLTIPEVEFFDITDCSANNGAVAPGVRYQDLNYDAESITLELTGYKNGSMKRKQFKNTILQGMEVKLEDFAYLPELDDIYTLKAVVYDLAGNCNEKRITFSVNRFGSVYHYDEKTAALVGENGAYYTKEEPEIVIYETNVDSLEFREITLNLNGKLKTLVEHKDFKVHESGNEQSWKQYTYEIAKDNFMEEGIYILTIYSEDRAKNLSDNITKGKKIEFVVDKTAPSVLITGIEHGKQYREASKEITIDVEDNVCIEAVEVTWNGETTSYNSLEVAKMNGCITYLMKSDNDWQTLQVTAYDTAGNMTRSEMRKVLITPNLLIQMYRNTPMFYMSLGLATILSGSVVILLLRKRKEKQACSS